MNTKLGVLALLVGAGMVLVTVGVGTGCSSSTSGTGGTTSATSTGTGSTTTTSTSSTKATTGTGATTSATTTAATGGGQTCADFCTLVAANCAGARDPFTSATDCMTKCATVPVGMATDTMGNTLGCRIYHAGAAKSSNMPDVHCPHTGVPSVNKDGTAGPCS